VERGWSRVGWPSRYVSIAAGLRAFGVMVTGLMIGGAGVLLAGDAEHWAVRDDAALMRQLTASDPLPADQIAATAGR
jgi:hypothetical protein